MLNASKKFAAFATALIMAMTMPGFVSAATTVAPTAADATPTSESTTADVTAAPPATPTVAANLYSVAVSDGKIYFMKNGSRVGSYSIQSADITVSINSNGNLLVGFPTRGGSRSSVTLGDQRTVQFGGTYNSITAANSLGGDVKLITDSQSSVSTITINAPIEAHIYGNAGTVDVQAAADLIVEKGATVTRARLVSSTSMLTANGTVKTVEKNSKSLVNGSGVVQTTSLTKTSPLASGTSIARSQSGLIIDRGNVYGSSSSSSVRTSSSSSSASTTTTSGDLRLTASTIYADYNDQLRTLTKDLQNKVRAYDRDSGKRVYGDVYWVKSDTTRVTSSGTYYFAFESDDSDYGDVEGRVRIVVDGRDYDDDYDSSSSSRGSRKYYFDIDKIEVDFDRSERRDYEVGDIIDKDEIEDYVTARDDDDDDEIDGKFELTSRESSTLGTSIGFRFRPDSSRYPVKTGSIKIKFADD